MSDFDSALQELLQQGIDYKIITHQELVFAACQVVRTVLHFIPKGEDRPRIAIETAEAWCFGKVTDDEVKNYINNVNNVSSVHGVGYYAIRAIDYAIAAAVVNVVHAITYTTATVYYVSRTTTVNITESQQQVKKILLSHLPRLNSLKVWL